MDESHRYRASAGVRAINELKPVLGLELTATPFVEVGKGDIQFQNIIYDYPLERAITDGFVKDPAVVTRKDLNPVGMPPEEIEQLKLEDGIRLHESIKAELITYARETDQPIVKPFVLVIARDTTHAAQLLGLIQSDRFFNGRYADRVIQVDSSTTGKKEDELVERLLKVESPDEPTEIVIHVNMLKEGWNVTNLYYRWQGEHPEYQPDFVAETDEVIYMLEPKMSTQMTDPQVLAKKEVAVEWCQQASDYMQPHRGKPWRYVLIPHDAIAENMTLKGLAQRYA